MKQYSKADISFSFLFLIIPIIFVSIGVLFFPYKPIYFVQRFQEPDLLLQTIVLFGGLCCLLVGFLWDKKNTGNYLKIAGWIGFSFFWATKTNELYYGEGEDVVNAFLCIAGIFLLCYLAYHEWLTARGKKRVQCLNWAAGVAAIAGLIYFVVELTPLANWLIEVVTAHSATVLNLIIGNIEVEGSGIFYNGEYVVNIIFACTAIQSIVIFVGGILPLTQVAWKRKAYGLLITVVPIYFLNLIRNALIAFLVKDNPDMFFMAHNVIGKGLSLVALVLLLLIVSKLIPELFDEIICLSDLPKRNGPLEHQLKKVWRKS